MWDYVSCWWLFCRLLRVILCKLRERNASVGCCCDSWLPFCRERRTGADGLSSAISHLYNILPHLRMTHTTRFSCLHLAMYTSYRFLTPSNIRTDSTNTHRTGLMCVPRIKMDLRTPPSEATVPSFAGTRTFYGSMNDSTPNVPGPLSRLFQKNNPLDDFHRPL